MGISFHFLFCLLFIITLCLSDGFGSYIISIPLAVACFIILFFSINFTDLLKKALVKSTEFKWLLLFMSFAFIGSILNIFTGHISFFRFLISYIITYVFSFAIYYLLGLILPSIISSKKIIKIFIIPLFIILLFGCIEFILLSMHFYPFTYIHAFLTGKPAGYIILKMGYPRIESLFLEPSIYAWFLCCIIPLTYSVFVSKIKLFKNKFLNIVFAKSILPMALISIILTQSPINLIFGISILFFTVCAFSKMAIEQLFKIVLFTLGIIGLFIILLLNVDISESYLNRIAVTFSAITDFDKLIEVEASLATRIVSYVNMFIIYLHHPIFGTGCGSLTTEMYKQLPNSPLPLTWELLNLISQNKASNANPAIFFKIIVDTGTVGIICFSLFLYNILIKTNKKLLSYYANISYFILGIKYTFITFVILMFYNSDIATHYFWALFGVISGLYLKMILQEKSMRK